MKLSSPLSIPLALVAAMGPAHASEATPASRAPEPVVAASPVSAAQETVALLALSARATFDPNTNMPAVVIRLDAPSAEAFAQFTTAHVGRMIEISVDGRVVTTAALSGPITGGWLMVSNGMTTEQTNEIAVKLRHDGKMVARLLPPPT